MKGVWEAVEWVVRRQSLRMRAVDCDLCGAGLQFRATSARTCVLLATQNICIDKLYAVSAHKAWTNPSLSCSPHNNNNSLGKQREEQTFWCDETKLSMLCRGARGRGQVPPLQPAPNNPVNVFRFPLFRFLTSPFMSPTTPRNPWNSENVFVLHVSQLENRFLFQLSSRIQPADANQSFPFRGLFPRRQCSLDPNNFSLFWSLLVWYF